MNIAIEKKLEFDIQALGKKIKEIRIKREMTQAQLAQELSQVSGAEISRVKVSRWEDGKNEPSASEVVAIAQFAKISIDELLGVKKSVLAGNFNANLTDDIVERIAQATAKKVAGELAKNGQIPCDTVKSGESGNMTSISPLSNLAQVRLRYLLRESLRQKKLSFKGAAVLAGYNGEEEVAFFSGMVELIIKGAEPESQLSPRFWNAIAFVCCRVKRWNQETLFDHSAELIPDTSHDSIEALIETLKRPVGNGQPCNGGGVSF